MSEVSTPEPSQAECLAFVKFARYTAITADRLAGALLTLSERLEEANLLDPNRPSRLARDEKLRSHEREVANTDHAVADLLKLLPNHPDGESLVESLFQDLDVPKIGLKPSNSARPSPNSETSSPDKPEE
jgi:hypothetical protein